MIAAAMLDQIVQRFLKVVLKFVSEGLEMTTHLGLQYAQYGLDRIIVR